MFAGDDEDIPVTTQPTPSQNVVSSKEDVPLTSADQTDYHTTD